MSSNIRDQLRMSSNRQRYDPSLLKYPSDPPRYTEVSNRRSTMAPKVDDPNNHSHAPWLLRRTSIHVESAPVDFLDDGASEVISIPTTRSEERPAKWPFLNRIAIRHPEGIQDDRSSIAPSHMSDSVVCGTTVSIEAGKPKVVYSKHSKLRELKNLEQAASMKLWAGTGQPAEAWGKLLKVI